MLGSAQSLGAAGATEGPARQLWPATLASPPSTRRKLMACHIIVYFHYVCASFFVSESIMIVASPVYEYFPLR
jgi:hypothetical protein